jgi:hypothetical protein
MYKELEVKRTSFLVIFSDSVVLETYVYEWNDFRELHYAQYTKRKVSDQKHKQPPLTC